MPKHAFYTSIIVLATIILSCSASQAHKIRVFAYASGDKITAEAVFASGRPAKNSKVIVENSDGDTLLNGTTNDKGIFSFTIPQQAKTAGMDLNVVVDVGEGHRGTWLITAADYGAEKPAGSAKESFAQSSINKDDGSADPPATPSTNSQNCQNIEATVETIIAKELAPLKRMIAQQRVHTPSLQDIIGGLGYIFGLAGIIFYFKAKKETSSK